MANYLERLTALFDRTDAEILGLKAQLADAKQQLADALANDVADSERIAQAQADAEQARQALTQAEAALGTAQAALATDAEEDAALDALLTARENRPVE